MTAVKAAVLGAGSWGTAFAKVMADAGTEVTIWARRAEVAEAIAATRRNPDYLTDLELPAMAATHDPAIALRGADIVVLAVPSQQLRANLGQWVDLLEPHSTLLSLAKGIETDTLLRMSQVIHQVSGADVGRIAVLSGPNLAREIAVCQPAASVIGCPDVGRSAMLQQACATNYFRPYTNTDVVGVEIGGACKNVIALACGMAAGMGLGDNSIATIITRGLAEIIRLGVALGANPATLAGLAGIGDLVATCTSPLSRNRSFGLIIGAGGSIHDAQAAGGGQVVEGVKSCTSIRALATAHNVEMPLTEAVHQVCHENVPFTEAMGKLMGRRTTSE